MGRLSELMLGRGYNMTRKEVLVCEMPDGVYRANIGAIRSQFSRHVRVDIERTTNEKRREDS